MRLAWPIGMVHLTARALPGTLLIHDWTEALELWRRLVRAFPDARAICVMPNHVHVLAPDDHARRRLSGVMSGFARWRGHHRAQDAACWQPQPAVEPMSDESHERRMIRYILLNPCRGGLVADPLAWPLSLHRDLVGLGDPARRVRDPEAHHRYVSSDPTVGVEGTDLPVLSPGRASLAAVEAAVGAVLRLPSADVKQRARRWLVRAAWARENVDVPTLTAWLGVTRSAIYKLLGEPPTPKTIRANPTLYAINRVIGDPRFGPLVDRGPRTTWSQWRLHRRG